MAEKVKQIIRKCKEVGVTIVSHSQDMGSSNIATQKALGVKVDAATGVATPNSFSVNLENGEELKVFCVFDPSHLLKNWKTALTAYKCFLLSDDVVKSNNLP